MYCIANTITYLFPKWLLSDKIQGKPVSRWRKTATRSNQTTYICSLHCRNIFYILGNSWCLNTYRTRLTLIWNIFLFFFIFCRTETKLLFVLWRVSIQRKRNFKLKKTAFQITNSIKFSPSNHTKAQRSLTWILIPIIESIYSYNCFNIFRYLFHNRFLSYYVCESCYKN